MRRTLDQDETEEFGALIEKWIAPDVLKPEDIPLRPVLVRCSFSECENLDTCGRFSFNKFNREVEVSYVCTRVMEKVNQCF